MSTNKFSFWTIFGKLATIVALIWGLTQLYTYYLKQDYIIAVTGDHFSFNIPPDINNVLSKYANQLTNNETYDQYFTDKRRIDSIQDIERIIKKNKDDSETITLANIQYTFDYLSKYKHSNLSSNYKSYWRFNIKNDGNKPLEDLILELPFNGIYILSIQNELDVINEFTNQIKLVI
jgi:hypothetical protein